MTLHAGLVNPTCLQSFTVWYCSVYELCCLNSKKEKMKNFGAYGRIGIFYLTPCASVHVHVLNYVMIHHMTRRCALIRVYCEVKPLLCYAWFALVIYVCMHSSSKACRLLTTSDSRPRSVPMVSSPCARFVRRWTSEHQQWSLLDEIGECSPPQAVSCLCYNTSSS